jgi:hypothetical protein
MAATLTLRSVKGTPLTNNEVDANFTNLNSEISTLESDVSTAQSDIVALEGSVGPSAIGETVADIVGNMVTSNTESGISVSYDDNDNTLDFDVADFTLTIDGDASGNATISNLANATLTLDISSIIGSLNVGGGISTSDLSMTGSITNGVDATFTGDVNAANFNTTSDIALKDNVELIESPLDKLLQLSGYTFDWKNNGKSSVGVMAQEVEKVFPQIVSTDNNGVKRVSYDSLIPLLIEAIKELSNLKK